MWVAGPGWNLPCVHKLLRNDPDRMIGDNDRPAKSDKGHHADRSAWVIWGILVVLAVAILPFAVRNSEVVRHIATMCGFTIG